MTMSGKIVFGVFALTQLLDGALTYVGIQRGFPEGNPMIAATIPHVGVFASLWVWKLFGLTLGWILVVNRRALMLAFLTLAYWAFAALPWMLILGIL